MAVVYRHIRLDKNEVFYVGIGKTEKRAYSKKNRNIHWINVINKTNYEVEILFDDLSWQDACLKEIELIKLYGRKDLKKGKLVNLTDGGDGTLNIIVSKDKKLQMSIKSRGALNFFYGKNHSEENKKIISEKAKGRKLSNDVKLKISESLKGANNYWYNKKLSDEHKKKLSEIATGRKLSDELKEKIRLNNPKRIEIYRFINNEIYIFKSFREAEILTGISRKIIKKKFNDLGFLNKEQAVLKGLIINN